MLIKNCFKVNGEFLIEETLLPLKPASTTDMDLSVLNIQRSYSKLRKLN